MSGVDKILEKILNDARESADVITGQAELQADELRERKLHQAEKKAEDVLRAAQAEEQEILRRKQAVCDLELRKRTLAVKREAMQEAFDLAQERLLALEEERYRAFMQKLIVGCAALGDGELTVAARDAHVIDKRFVDRIEKQLKAEGTPVRLHIAGMDDSLCGGFIYAAGGMQVNCTVSAILEQQREALEASVYSVLFGD